MIKGVCYETIDNNNNDNDNAIINGKGHVKMINAMQVGGVGGSSSSSRDSQVWVDG